MIKELQQNLNNDLPHHPTTSTWTQYKKREEAFLTRHMYCIYRLNRKVPRQLLWFPPVPTSVVSFRIQALIIFESSYATFTTIKDSFLSIDLWKHSEILRGSAHESHSWQIASPIWRAAIPLILLLDGSLLIGALQQLHQFFYNRVIFFLCGSK